MTANILHHSRCFETTIESRVVDPFNLFPIIKGATKKSHRLRQGLFGLAAVRQREARDERLMSHNITTPSFSFNHRHRLDLVLMYSSVGTGKEEGRIVVRESRAHAI